MKNQLKLTFVLLIVFYSSATFGQTKDKYYFNMFIAGSSLTYRGNNDVFLKSGEYTWNLNFASSVGKHFFCGIQVLNIFTDYRKVNIETKKNTVFGIFTQYNITPYSQFRPFLELSYNRGNYYFPPDAYYPENNKYYTYIGMGGGADMPLAFISKNLFIDLSFIFYLQKPKDKIIYDYNQYIIGINYRFGKM